MNVWPSNPDFVVKELQNIRQQEASSQIHFAVGTITSDKLKIEKDELSESSWVMQWLTGSGNPDLALQEDRQYLLQFAELEGQIRIQVVDANETLNVSEDGDVSGTALAEQLRNLLVDSLE
jgi:hypothetical protein